MNLAGKTYKIEEKTYMLYKIINEIANATNKEIPTSADIRITFKHGQISHFGHFQYRDVHRWIVCPQLWGYLVYKYHISVD